VPSWFCLDWHDDRAVTATTAPRREDHELVLICLAGDEEIQAALDLDLVATSKRFMNTDNMDEPFIVGFIEWTSSPWSVVSGTGTGKFLNSNLTYPRENIQFTAK
jgi:hypothetical protein